MDPILPNNILLTCGRTQLSPAKLKAMAVPAEACTRIEQICNDKESEPNEFFLQNKEAIDLARIIADCVEPFWDGRRASLGDMKSVYGPEVHTLTALEFREHKQPFRPQIDRVVLVTSQTYSGMLAAMTVAAIGEKRWKIPPRHIEVKMVRGLSEEPANPELAMASLANIIKTNLKGNLHNIFAATGGFKSTMPCLTIFSLRHGVELVYMFEQSSKLQSLEPNYNFSSKEWTKEWKELWKNLERQGWTGEQMPAYMRVALSELVDPPKPF